MKKGVNDIMILFTILATIAIIVFVIGVSMLIAGGAAFTVVFGDLIVCVALIVLLIKLLFGRKN
jgi:hypothetical protein